MKSISIGLVGNPNCGKTTLFNELTGARQKVGNWPGVTVECKTGIFHTGNRQINVVDLPGIYQLACEHNSQAIDEKIACKYILSNQADLYINIIDAAHLERHLYLTLQLLTMRVPMIVVINMLDVAKRRHMDINLQKLETLLGCPVIGVVANKGMGIEQLKETISSHYKNAFSDEEGVEEHKSITYPQTIQKSINQLTDQIKKNHSNYGFCAEWLSIQLLQCNHCLELNQISKIAKELRTELECLEGEELDIVFADIFYKRAHEITKVVCKSPCDKETKTQKIDKILLHRFLGLPIFFAVMYFMFLFAINFGGAFQDFFDIGSEAIFVQGTTGLLNSVHAPSWLVILLAAGVGKGINTTISFIPVISAMFFFLAFLESSGYMTRASYVIDRFMRTVGLPGKAFVPMIIGFGCNVPAILAARTLDSPRDRILAIVMSPFMSCGARLAIFAVFCAAFFPTGGQNIVFLLYVIGILAAVLTGFLLRKTVLKGDLTPLVLELPPYHMPSIKSLLQLTLFRLKSFIFRAGKLIVPICMLIGILNSVDLNSFDTVKKESILAALGRKATPLLAPMGIKDENWPATVGLLTGVLAKEVVVATLNTLYAQEGHVTDTAAPQSSMASGLQTALLSVPKNLVALKDSFANPIIASTPDHSLNHQVYGVMYERFGGKAGAFAYLLFVLLYFPCISATAVMVKELNKKWALFSVAWSTTIAYSVATTFYQLSSFYEHPYSSLVWITAISVIFTGIFSIMKKYGNQRDEMTSYVNTYKTVS